MTGRSLAGEDVPPFIASVANREGEHHGMDDLFKQLGDFLGGKEVPPFNPGEPAPRTISEMSDEDAHGAAFGLMLSDSPLGMIAIRGLVWMVRHQHREMLDLVREQIAPYQPYLTGDEEWDQGRLQPISLASKEDADLMASLIVMLVRISLVLGALHDDNHSREVKETAKMFGAQMKNAMSFFEAFKELESEGA